MKFIFALILLASPLTSFALPTRSPIQIELYNLAEKPVCNFERETCTEGYSYRPLVPTDANEELFDRLGAVATRQAQVWGDTILEGDYYAFGSTRLGKVLEIYEGERLVAYHFEFFEYGIETDAKGCKFDETQVSTTDELSEAFGYGGRCTIGRIFEAGYASADFSVKLRDEERMATFFVSAKDKEERGYDWKKWR